MARLLNNTRHPLLLILRMETHCPPSVIIWFFKKRKLSTKPFFEMRLTKLFLLAKPDVF
jgi:hypothetical protein